MGKRILERINSPKDLKVLSIDELYSLAQEIRDLILETVSRTGGHLASSLGAVELTLALHYVFDTPRDKIIWDVGHQTYAHKIITGRRDNFRTLRQYKGISGFPRSSESEYDCFDVGHASTAVSIGIGIATARDLQGDDYEVISVIGDGSLTGGLAFEGLNHAGFCSERNFKVILNDNEMSISKSVGAICEHLSRRNHKHYKARWQREAENIIQSFSQLDPHTLEILRKAGEKLQKSMIVPGLLLEELGFQYIGPINGHDIDSLIRTFELAKKVKGPVFIHTITCKGKGYKPAEINPASFHGAAPFTVKSGKFRNNKKSPSYTECFSKFLLELAEKNKNIIAITAAMPEGTGLNKFAERFPERFFDVGIAEQHAVTFAAGLAKMGLKPVVAIYSTFLQRAFDSIIHDVCLTSKPVVFAIDRAGIVGADGPTHHGAFDLSYLRLIPNMVVMAPKDENELKSMLFTAINYNGPIAFRYPRGEAIGLKNIDDYQQLEIGKGELLRYGDDIAIIAIGSMVYPSLKAAEMLSLKGVNAAVVNARFVKPIDEHLIIEIAKRCGMVLTVEENSLLGGFGDAVLDVLHRARLNEVIIEKIGIPDEFIEHGPADILLNNLGLSPQGIFDKAMELVISYPEKNQKSSLFKNPS